MSPASAKPTGKLSLKVSKDMGAGDRTFLSLPDINQSHGKVVRVDVYEIAQMVKANPNIFNANVRSYLGSNKVNKDILSTLSDKESITTFIYLNNGITILCDGYQIKPGNEVIDLTNPFIINGCQTASTIREAFDLNKIEPNTGLVLVRIIDSADTALKEAIIKASNNQSVVKERDLISEDAIQKELESQFQTMGYRYQRKRGFDVGLSKEEREKVIDLEKAAQAYMALFLDRPAEAKNKKAEIYDDYYRDIFHPQINAVSLLVGYRMLEGFRLKIKSQKKRYSTDQKGLYGNAVLHLLPLFKHWILIPANIALDQAFASEKIMGEIDALFESKSDSVLAKLSNIMEKIKNEHDFKNYQYFFKSATSLTRLLTAPGGDVNYQIELNRENYKAHNDLRYTKPQEYTLDGKKYERGETWQELFVNLMNLYGKQNNLADGNLDFIDSGSRKLLLANPNDEERKLRKQIGNGLWLLTNYDSKRLCDFCFTIAAKLKLELAIKIRPTKYRVENKLQ